MAEESLESTTSQHDENTFEPTPTPATTHRDVSLYTYIVVVSILLQYRLMNVFQN